jgi:hypothetical protein
VDRDGGVISRRGPGEGLVPFRTDIFHLFLFLAARVLAYLYCTPDFRRG